MLLMIEEKKEKETRREKSEGGQTAFADDIKTDGNGERKREY